jgi:HNH endonuclease
MAMKKSKRFYQRATNGSLYEVEEVDPQSSIMVDGVMRPATHCMFMCMMNRWPLPGHTIIHVDGNPKNCKWSNLREVPIA